MAIEPNQSAGGLAAASGLGANGYLEFEKPLLRISQEISGLESRQIEGSRDFSQDIRTLRNKLRGMTKRLYSNLTAWETVLVARHPRRPLITDYIQAFVKDFFELHGDRCFGDDKAIVTGFGRIAGHKVMLVGHNKGKDTRERLACNFGCAHPEGYRKALAKMKLAAKYGVPVVCMIDTQGAYPGIGSEERGIAQAIAVNLMEMSRLPTPIVCVVIGEGGSGGALGVGVGDRVAMFEHSFYSVISPEGCAAILWKTGEQRQRAAESLKLTARELKKLDIVDHIIPEPLGGAHRDPAAAAASLEAYLGDALRDLTRFKIETLLKRRYDRIRQIGSFFDSANKPKTVAAKRAGTSSPGRSALPAGSRLAKLETVATA
ncbi:MAG TPA: acetyl-CoA carboxylase carboxyltransferase subunit alpha [Phycisphaerae bacterium]|jgi:acetyl-CoA carboxylase carboxyl transferase subunit alpha